MRGDREKHKPKRVLERIRVIEEAEREGKINLMQKLLSFKWLYALSCRRVHDERTDKMDRIGGINATAYTIKIKEVGENDDDDHDYC